RPRLPRQAARDGAELAAGVTLDGLDGDDTLELPVARLVDDAHGALAEGLQQLVALGHECPHAGGGLCAGGGGCHGRERGPQPISSKKVRRSPRISTVSPPLRSACVTTSPLTPMPDHAQ